MKAQLKGWDSPDISRSYWPKDPLNFCFLIEAMIGADDSEGEDIFNIEVCTPEWLRSHWSNESILMGRLIVLEYDLNRIIAYISDYCGRCQGESWNEVAVKLAKLGAWEFEGYKGKTLT